MSKTMAALDRRLRQADQAVATLCRTRRRGSTETAEAAA
jgi:hypothetical protein